MTDAEVGGLRVPQSFRKGHGDCTDDSDGGGCVLTGWERQQRLGGRAGRSAECTEVRAVVGADGLGPGACPPQEGRSADIRAV